MKKLLIAAFALVLVSIGHSANAQGSFGWGYSPVFGPSTTGYSNTGFVFTPRFTPPARYDSRLDPSMVRAAKLADQRAGNHSTLRCWRSVKDALLAAGAVHSRPTTAYASQAGDELMKQHGFVKLETRDPYRAPVGAVIVYSGHGAGHVELRTSRGFASDYHSTSACRYHVVGVYAKLVS